MPTLAVSNNERMGYSAEATWGTTVSASPIKLLRYVSGAFKSTIGSTRSNEIINAREVSDHVRTKVRGDGSVNFELSYGLLDDLFQGLLGSTWTIGQAAPTTPGAAAVGTGGTFAAGTYYWKITAIGPGGESLPTAEVSATLVLNGSATITWTVAAAATGYRIYRGTTPGGENVYYTVGAVATYTDINAASTPGSPPTAAAGTLKVGTTRNSFTFERQFIDVARYISYPGAMISSVSLSVGIGKIISGSFNFLSKGGVDAAVTAGTGTTAVTTGTIMNPIDSVQLVSVGGVTLTGVSDVSMSITSAVMDFEQIGSLSPADMEIGEFEVAGSFSLFYEDTLNTPIRALNNNWTDSSLAVTLGGSTSQKYAILFNKIKITQAEVPNGGMNQPLMAKYAFKAKIDSVNSTMLITRTP